MKKEYKSRRSYFDAMSIKKGIYEILKKSIVCEKDCNTRNKGSFHVTTIILLFLKKIVPVLYFKPF